MQEDPGKMTDAPKTDWDSSPVFQRDHQRSEHPLESRVAALEDAMRRNNAELKAQRAVNEALEGWFAHGKDPATRRVLSALREALE